MDREYLRTRKKKEERFTFSRWRSTNPVKGLQRDINPILDTGAPTSTGGTNNAMELAEMLGITFEVYPPSELYKHG